MVVVYATKRDLYDFGLPRGTLGSNSRLVAYSRASNDTLELEDHGFVTGDPILLRAVEGGTLSAPLVDGVTYYAIRLTESTFKVTTTPTGSALNLTTDGKSMLVMTPLPFERVLEGYSRFVDSFVSEYRPDLVPLSPCPTHITMIVAELAAKKLQNLAGITSVIVENAEVSAKAQLERWAKTLVATQVVSSGGVAVRDLAPRSRGELP